MTQLILALTVGILFACGAYLVMRRGKIKLILGLGLFSHGVNLLLFGSGEMILGKPAIFNNKANFLGELATRGFADPLPQALILTAIVISFGITAFMIVLLNRRDTLIGSDMMENELAPGYDWLVYTDDDLDEQRQKQAESKGNVSPTIAGGDPL